jgi:hypothetical protein
MPMSESNTAQRRRAVLLTLWVGISSAFTIGAGFEDVHSVAFAIYAGGTITGVLVFVAVLTR